MSRTDSRWGCPRQLWQNRSGNSRGFWIARHDLLNIPIKCFNNFSIEVVVLEIWNHDSFRILLVWHSHVLKESSFLTFEEGLLTVTKFFSYWHSFWPCTLSKWFSSCLIFLERTLHSLIVSHYLFLFFSLRFLLQSCIVPVQISTGHFQFTETSPNHHFRFVQRWVPRCEF